MRRVTVALLAAGLALTACKGREGRASSSGGESTEAGDDGGRCPRPDDDPRSLEVSDYDTNGDGKPDVRKVYLVVGDGVDRRIALICREVDLNGDGVKDVVRHYDDEGSTVREESDRNFDGKMDSVTSFDQGQVVFKMLDEDRDGRFETKLVYEDGAVIRIERDVAGREPETFRTDRWEYVEGGRVVRIGVDLDGDGKVDRWDRDIELERERRERERREATDAEADDDTADDEDERG